MKKKTVLLILKFLLFFSCSLKNNSVTENIKQQEKQEQHFIVLASGDTLFTGVPIKLKKEEIPLGYVKKKPLQKAPEVYKSHKGFTKAKTPNIVSIASIEKKLDEAKLGNKELGKDTTLVGIHLDIKLAKPENATSPSYKDAAIYDIQCMGLDQGLGSEYVYSILEDSKGFLWFGCYFDGLTRFDGKVFTRFVGGDDILSTSSIWTMLEDHQGNFWFSCIEKGVVKYDGKTFTQYSSKNGFLSDNIFGIAQDRNNNIWFTTDKGIVKYNGKHFTNYNVEDGLSGNIVISVIEDSKGNMWFGTTYGLTVYSESHFITYTHEDGLPPKNIISMFEDSKGNIWLGTYDGGLCKYDGKTLSIFTEKEGLHSNSIKGIKEDKNGHLWLASNKRGLGMYDGETFHHISINDGVPNDRIRTMLIDKQQNLWAGTQGGGAFKFNLNSFMSGSSNPKSDNTLDPKTVYSIYEDKHANIWYANIGGEISKFDGQNFTIYGEAQGVNYNEIFEIITDHQDNIWFGSWKGLIKFDGTHFYEYNRKSGLKHERAFDLIEDTHNNIWFTGYDSGLSKLTKEGITYYTMSKNRDENRALCVYQDSEENIWFGTESLGLCKYNPKEDTFIFYTENEGLAGNYVLSITEDKYKNIWASTSKGASRFDGSTFTNFTKKEGVLHETVSSVTEDENGNLWLTTMRGISCIVTDEVLVSKADKSKRIDNGQAIIVNFNKKDGLKSIDFYSDTLLSSGNLLRFTTSGGLIFLDLKRYEFSNKAPLLNLDTVEINEQFIDYNGLNDKDYLKSLGELSDIDMYVSNIEAFSNYPQKLYLPYNYNHLNFKFSAIDWNAPHAVKFSFKIEGLDEDWSAPTENNYADYRNIPVGKYIFKLKAVGKSAQWSKPIEYPFSISAPWWLSIWAKIIYILFVATLFMFSFKWYNNSMKRKQLVLENIVKERTSTISQQKEALTIANKNLEQERNKMELKALLNQINPHFIFNTLNSIQQFIVANNTKNSLDYFNKFGKLIRSSLEHSEKKFVSLKEEISVIQNYVALENLRFYEPVMLNFITNGIDAFNVTIPPMFIQPIVENAIIHGLSKKENNKTINIEFKEFDEYVLCSIHDNGLGRLHNESIKNTNSGLKITQNRLKSVWVENNSNNSNIIIEDLKDPTGTIVTIKLPKEI